MADNTVAIDIEVKVGDLEGRLSKIEASLDDIAESGKKAGKEVTGGFESAGEMAKTMPGPIGAAATAMSALRAGAMKFVVALKTVRGALMATGIGALVVAVGTLMAYFTKTERGAQALRVASAALGAVMGAVMDVVIGLGEGLFNLFTSPIDTIKKFATTLQTYVIDNFNRILSGAGLLASSLKKLFAKDLAGALADAKKGTLELGEGFLKLNPATAIVANLTEGAIALGKEIAEDVKAATKLAEAFNILKVSNRELGVEMAQRRADIKELNKLAEDVTESFEARRKAAEDAAALEDELLQKRLANAEEQVRIIAEQNRLSETGEEDLQKLADAEIALANIRMESMELQTTIQNKLNTIKMQEIALSNAAKVAAIEEAKAAEEAAKIKAEKIKSIEQELADSKIAIIRDEQTRRVLEADANFEAKLAAIEGETAIENELRANLKQLWIAEVAEIEKEGSDKAIAQQKEAADKKKAILDKEEADVKKTEEAKQADRQKGLAAASSIVGSLGQLAGLMGKQSAESVALQKTMAIAQVAINTAMSISAAIAGATSSAAATGPGAVVATPVFIATQIATVLAALAQVGTILASVPGPSAGGSISGASANIPSSAPPSIDPVTTSTSEFGNAQGAQLAPIQAFVIETEMTGNQNNISQIENQITFGIDG